MNKETRGLAAVALGLWLFIAAGGLFYMLTPATSRFMLPAPSPTPYAEVLRDFTPAGRGWIELQPGMGLYIQNALFREGSQGRDRAHYIGVEEIRYLVAEGGGIVQDGQPARIAARPAGAPRIDELIPTGQKQYAHHRLLYQVLSSPTDEERAAILVSAESQERLQSLTEGILSKQAPPDDLASDAYTVFPGTASVGLEITILLDNTPTRVPWRDTLERVAGSRSAKLFRPSNGAWSEVLLDSEERHSRRMPLLPGDRVEFKP